MKPDIHAKMSAALNRLAKWRMILAGWQLGTRTQTDPESNAVRDHRESTLIQRAELIALTNLLIDKGVIDANDFGRMVAHEADLLSAAYSKKFPGFIANDHGMTIDAAKAEQTTRGWKP
jgi:hypothetical protein